MIYEIKKGKELIGQAYTMSGVETILNDEGIKFPPQMKKIVANNFSESAIVEMKDGKYYTITKIYNNESVIKH